MEECHRIGLAPEAKTHGRVPEEDGVDEAGRPTESPVAADGSDGKDPGGILGAPPLPADEIGRVKPGSSPYALGYRSGLAASSGGSDGDPGKGDGSVIGDSVVESPADDISAGRDDSADGNGSGNGDHLLGEDEAVGAEGTAAGTGELFSGAAASLGDKLGSGRQAVRQAAAATTSWFANRAGTPAPPEGTIPAASGPELLSRADSAAPPETRPQSLPRRPSPASPSPAPSSYAGGYPSAAVPSWQDRNAGPDRGPDPSRRGRRQAHLTLARVEPWSVMKFSFVASVVAFIILFVAITVLYMALSALGVFSSLQHTVSTITSSQSTAGTDISGWFSASRILGYTGMLGALNIVLITALSTIGAVVYNLIAHVFGGIEVTLRESD